MKIKINKFTQKVLKESDLKIEKVEIVADKQRHLEFYISFVNVKSKEARSGYVELKHPDLIN